ncbi:hypothetical protein ILUMI_22236 [Ignelater luminosus]|uniref:BTB domain-containing protein n=1 Tax=Ignelater luminosus TaxID=2038154 RepID=A0A8K0CB17_IGNLU|nr:hypothetical protein ILUMI_22236 [Ignelater luminosus]
MSHSFPNAEDPAHDWQMSKDYLQDCTRHILQNRMFTDCQFKVQAKSSPMQFFEAHRLILTIASPVFEKMFYGIMAEKNQPIVVEDIEPEVFKALLEYIYTGDINLESSDYYYELYYAAKKYMLPFLQKKCIIVIQENINTTNACKGYEFAELFEESSLMEYCLEVISRRTENVLSEANLKDIKLNTIITILDQDCLNVRSEMTLFNAVTICAKNNNKDKDTKPLNERGKHQSLLREALQKIRFLIMTPKEFAEGPALSDLLTKFEKFDILMNISSPASTVAMPSGFSTSTTSRKMYNDCWGRGYYNRY